MTPLSDDPAVLLLRLAGPLQSWGDASRFNRRDTRSEPTKSGVVGLLAAALGRDREADISDLAALTMAVRADQPGSLLRDYHTVSDYRGLPLKQTGVNAKGIQKPTSPTKHTHVTVRYYLQDAAFLVGLTGQAALIAELATAIRRPVHPLALGRRSCPPTQPIVLGTHTGPLLTAMQNQTWLAADAARAELLRAAGHTPAQVDLPVTIDDDHGTAVRHDSPISFALRGRRYAERRVRHLTLRVPSGFPNPDPDPDNRSGTGHDPFALLGW
ncbi:type I-E CRISPR-associated protein Cas5/CasD [Nocardia farcinica]|uniref:type I-E CRISPR-associated protein Cas5/CasD n=1 Tax=Nocardia farcinica TaxID=37329 RepID=UPI001895B460|nr:type I-E CRISPR-associated protein Cas5/CasD [Nocardia farcinica]MBF6266007.1 type I-E CRISPR-associated protein Cas5/CasD [Nocardia farcinica]MBF6284549.1 type I-E CRISPR-associated protein Cas5/CasD [Nocardia farcinica]MBF6309003.1 type I-E CRISPR-associated protein Cas5/CasD [Nocardia farcinica]MBF6393003.1 type I-E CRISPR-associated protein Cas5/CasD [Nocardia farcinica]MBF6527610.1 type I-E CRISPR-associated protein Cas5/CasD [Nocardia farcinica]